MIIVGSTLAAFVMDQPDTWGAWLRHAEAFKESHPDGVQFFCAIEVDSRGLDPFGPLLDRLAEIGGGYWTYLLDDKRESVQTTNRVRHIVCGQNLVNDYASSHPACTHMLFLAADLEPDPQTLPKLLEMNWPIVGGHVSTYGLTGARLDHRYPFHAEEHMATAAYVMLDRSLFRKLRWRWDLDVGMTDDPCLHSDALAMGWPTHIRHDCIGKHFPDAIGAIETRGHDMKVHR